MQSGPEGKIKQRITGMVGERSPGLVETKEEDHKKKRKRNGYQGLETDPAVRGRLHSQALQKARLQGNAGGLRYKAREI